MKLNIMSCAGTLLKAVIETQKKKILRQDRAGRFLSPVNISSQEYENSPKQHKTDTRFKIVSLNINYPKPLLAASLIKCFSCVLPLGNPPHQKNGEWERLNDSE